MKNGIHQGDNFYMKRLTEVDITDDYLSLFSNRELYKYYNSTDRDFSKQGIMTDLIQGESEKSQFIYGVFLNSGTGCIGHIKISSINYNHRLSDLVAFIPNSGVRGLAARAIKLGSEIAFDEFNIRKITGGMFAGNVFAIKAYLAAGFLIEGNLKGHYLVDGQPMDRVLISKFNPKCAY